MAALTPSILNTTVAAIARFGPDDRDCYQDNEFKFKHLRWEDGLRYLVMIVSISFKGSFRLPRRRPLNFRSGQLQFSAEKEKLQSLRKHSGLLVEV